MSEPQENGKSRRRRARRGRGEGAIYQRADGLWVASVSLGYDANGKRRRKVVYGQTKQEAQDELRQAQAQYALGHFGQPDKYTVEDHIRLWLDTTVRSSKSRGTYMRYKQTCDRHILPRLGTLKLAKLTSMQIVYFYAALEKAGASARTRAYAGVVLGAALHNAVRMGLIPANPCHDVARPAVAGREMAVYTAEQARAFLEAARSDRFYALYPLALDTGMRQGELLALHWPDIDFEAGAVQVHRTLEELTVADGDGKSTLFRFKEPKTKKSRRRIDLSPFALDALHEHRKAMLAEGQDVRTGLVFCTTTGKPIGRSNLCLQSFRRVLKRAGLPKIRFHDLRHTAATLMLQAGENIKVVSECLGHSNIKITLETYAHVLPAMRRDRGQRMQTVLAGPAAKPEIGYSLATEAASTPPQATQASGA